MFSFFLLKHCFQFIIFFVLKRSFRSDYSFMSSIRMPAFLRGGFLRHAAALGGLEILRAPSTAISDHSADSAPSKVGDVVTGTPPAWMTSGSLSRGCNQQGLPRQSFMGRSENMAEQM